MRKTRLSKWGRIGLATVLAAVMPLASFGGTVLASASTVAYTTDADFAQGVLLNVNFNAPGSNQLQLNKTTQPFPFVNIAASGRGTAIRINANTGEIVGEYLTAPGAMAKDPSRTTVDQQGNVWVTNRAEGGGGKGSIARIGLVLGGTRADALGVPDAAGDYLKPPFQYNTCVDRDGDGLIRTSRGLGTIVPWTNAGNADTNGGVTTAQDECIINFTRTIGTYTRTVAIDANNDVWVGGMNSRHEKLSGITGQPVPGTQRSFTCGGYGGLIDRQGILWSARFGSGLLRYDPATDAAACYGFNQGDYGLGISPATGNIWQSSLSGNWQGLRLYEFNSAGTVLNSYAQPFGAQGVAVDGNNHVWMAEIFGSRIWHLAPDPSNPGQHIPVGLVTGLQGVTGVAVDASGKIWAAEYSGSRASRIDPNAGPVGMGGYKVGQIDLSVSLGAGAWPYNYSDMTGFVAIGATSPQGSWTVVQDSGVAGNPWGKIIWNQEPEGQVPAGASIVVEARAAETQVALAGQAFLPVANGVAFALTGQLLEVRVTMKAAPSGESPVLSDITIAGANQPPAVSLPAALSVDEGSALTVTPVASDPDGDTLTYAWAILSGPGSLSNLGATADYAHNDGPAAATVEVTVSDGKGGTASATTMITVNNVDPDITGLTIPGSPVLIHTQVAIATAYTDAGSADTHTLTVDWGDGATDTNLPAAGGSATATHTYTTPGVYAVEVTVTDDDGGSDTLSSTTTQVAYIPVYDPAGGFVTGGGWIDSSAGACRLAGCTDQTVGRVSFGFVSRYQRGASTPSGQTEFQFKVGNLNFHSSAYDWLVVAGMRAQYKGTGTINGAGNYGFMLTAVDDPAGDRFRIKIWDKATGTVVYDNQVGADDGAPLATLIRSGSIVIHSK